MLKIGEFARICHVSTQTLRYYDAEGVLPADHIDRFTGYRYYAPEKLEVFRRIQGYKEVGFSLEEIRELLRGDENRCAVLMAMRRRELHQELNGLQAKLSLLEQLSGQSAAHGELPLALSSVLSASFEDDEEVVGRWSLCGYFDAPADADFPDRNAPLLPIHTGMDAFSHIVFLPGGRPWWAFLWSRGVLYRMYPLYRTLIPNPYTIWKQAGEVYMTVRYVGEACLRAGGDPVWPVYRRVEHRALTELESHIRVDRTDYPSVPDLAVVGRWEVVDFLTDPAAFVPDHPHTPRANLWLAGLTFDESGSCRRALAEGGGVREEILPYTRREDEAASDTEVLGAGVILNFAQATAEAYRLRPIGGEVYLFVQHKSGDYIYGGREAPWYVLRRVVRSTSSESADRTPCLADTHSERSSL